MEVKKIITFSLKNYKHLNNLETVAVGSTIVKTSEHCKLGVTFDKHMDSKHKFKNF